MYRNDLIRMANSGDINDFVPLDRSEWETVGIPEDVGAKLFESRDLINSVVYYDRKRYLILNTGMMVIDGHIHFSTPIEHFLDQLKKDDFSNLTNNILRRCPTCYQMDLLCYALKDPDITDKYSLFMKIYPRVDFGFEKLTSEDIINVFKDHKPDISNLPKKVKVYRGIGGKSLKYGFSYTLSWDVARFFAFRLSDRESFVRILEGWVDRDDVLAIISEMEEEELIIMPDKIYDKEYLVYPFDGIHIDFNEYNQYIHKLQLVKSVIDSNDHDKQHMARVLVLTMLLEERYPVMDRETLFMAATFHDIGREHDGEDQGHGKKSFDLLKDIMDLKNLDRELLEFLMTYHCKDDSEVEDANDDYIRCLNILKDADALDRQRFDIRELDSRYLRLPHSKELSYYAYRLTKVKMF